MVRWFRHYPGLARDEKLVAAALRSGQPVERVVWLWSAILEAASSRDEDGLFDLDLDECAWFLRVLPSDLADILHALEKGGRIRDGKVMAWTCRQFASDRSTDRTREWRKRHAANGSANGRANGHATSPKRHRDAPETEPESETEPDLLGAIAPRAPSLAPKPEHFVESWNNLAARHALPQVRTLTPARRKSVRARLEGYSVAEIREVLDKIEASPFLLGERNWSGVTFDWILKKANFQKVLEGNYRD